MKYLAQCVAGLQEVVAQQLQLAPFAPVRILMLEEGLAAFETTAQPREIGPVPYLNSVFIVLAELNSSRGAAVDDLLCQLARDSSWHSPAATQTSPRERTFRVRVSDHGKLVRVDPQLRHTLIRAISRATGLRRDPRSGDTEFWLLRRRSNKAFFCKRLARRRKTERDLLKGELRPELAHLLCLLSEPTARDVFLDPFTGTGAIPLARVTTPYNMIFASDIDVEKATRLRKHVKRVVAKNRRSNPFIVFSSDARHLDRFEDGFVDKIVTDPPWGIYDVSVGDVPALYRSALQEFCRILRPRGLLVMLLADPALLDTLPKELSPHLDLTETYRILVSGHKAIVTKWRRK